MSKLILFTVFAVISFIIFLISFIREWCIGLLISLITTILLGVFTIREILKESKSKIKEIERKKLW